ncbi:hypothetical protein HZH68_008385 [Vespula germanica]|uniref:Uncharacterized protein n=1 Tax=Vespula germanica TaxID=30212 RepID=A0A834K461_VESGE|nr:hypothetical protein HZH68_008385 [Vespula germanica]
MREEKPAERSRKEEEEEEEEEEEQQEEEREEEKEEQGEEKKEKEEKVGSSIGGSLLSEREWRHNNLNAAPRHLPEMEKKLIEPLHSACRIESNFTRYAVDVPCLFKVGNPQRTDDFSRKDNISIEMGRGTLAMRKAESSNKFRRRVITVKEFFSSNGICRQERSNKCNFKIENITSDSQRKARPALSYDKFGHNHALYTKQSTLTAEI